MTNIINIYHNEPYDVYCGREGKGHDGYFGNQYTIDSSIKDPLVAREKCVNEYRKYFYSRIETDPEFKRRVMELKDRTLGCFCYPKMCHVMVIVEYLDNISIADQLKNANPASEKDPVVTWMTECFDVDDFTL